MNKKNSKYIIGLSLIEILIGIVITSIMMAAMYTSYNEVNQSYSKVAEKAKISKTFNVKLNYFQIRAGLSLKEWRKRFLNNRNKAKKIYDERFCKMWEFYLAACQSSFEYAGSVVFQIQLAKTNSPVPQTRDYIYK